MTVLALYRKVRVLITPLEPIVLIRFRFDRDDRTQDQTWRVLPNMMIDCTACGVGFVWIRRGEWCAIGHGCVPLQPFLQAKQADPEYADMIAPLYMHELITNG